METSPRHWMDVVFWPLLMAFWEPFTRKRSHWWHWKPYHGQLVHAKRIARDLDAAPRRGSWFSNFYQTNFGWRTAVILEPRHYCGKYHIGFQSNERKLVEDDLIMDSELHLEYCTVVLSGRSAALVGPDPVLFFAISYPEGRFLELKTPVVTQKWKLPLDVVLI